MIKLDSIACAENMGVKLWQGRSPTRSHQSAGVIFSSQSMRSLVLEREMSRVCGRFVDLKLSRFATKSPRQQGQNIAFVYEMTGGTISVSG